MATAVLVAAAGMVSFGGAAQALPSRDAASQPPACPVPGSSVQPLYRDTHYSFTERAADLVSCMTLAEKVAQLQSDSAPAIPRLGVKQYTYWNEGQHGLLISGATSFPVNFASTMTWDPSLVYQETTAISNEVRGYASTQAGYGPLTYWAPTVNMDRDPRWGRTDEAFGEDPYLVGAMAGAFVEGYQGETMTGRQETPYLKVAATAKHYSLNNVEDNRESGSSDTTDADIRDYYTKQFESLTENAHVSGVMTSYNAVNGTPSTADTYTDNELLQRTYGFNGYTTSDCGAVGTIYAAGLHEWAPPGWTTDGTTWTDTATGQTVPAAAGGQAYALRAGTEVNCTGGEPTVQNIEAAINAGLLSVGVLDNALVHMFTIRMETGEFDPPGKVSYTKLGSDQLESPAHEALAEKVAADDLVLLKNDDVSGTHAPLLPVNPAKLSNVVIVGNLANTVTLGGYSGDPTLQVSAVQGITAAVKAADPDATVTYDSCGTSTTASAPASCSAATQAAIKTASLVVVFVGTDENVASEGHDRTSLEMPGNYNSLISQVAAQGNPRTAMVIQSDGPVDISATQGDFPAIVFSGYNGESQGTALAQVLFGQVNPAGHLDFTWFKDDSQLPDIMNYGLTPSQTGGLGRTYMYFTGTPTYPFGYGLSYSTFRYSHLSVGPRTVSAAATVPVTFDVTNTGTRRGATVAQLYVAPPGAGTGDIPREQLAGFQRTKVLAPGQTQRITLHVKVASLSRWDETALKQVVADGAYQFRVGPDSATAALTAAVTVTGTMPERVQYVTVQPDQVIFKPGDTLDLTGVNPWIAPDTDASLEQPHAPADDIVEAVNTDQSFVNLATARVTYSSSDPRVATVSPAGLVTAVGRGAATIRVTVNGVTGTAPIVVQQPFTVSGPAVAVPGSTVTVTTSLPDTGSRPLTNVSQTLSVPSGWTATATSPSSFASVAPGDTAQTTWNVTVPAGASAGSNELDASAAFTDASGQGTVTGVTDVTVPFPALPDAFNNVGISDDANPTSGNIDGDGDSYSAESLAAAGLSPGATVTEGGISYTWPSVPAGQPDNVQTAGQAISVNASGVTLGFLGMAESGTHAGTGTIAYTDGTTQSYTITYPDWFLDGPGGTPDQLVATGTVNGPFAGTRVSVLAAEVPLQPGKAVSYITLPDDAAMHIFAIGVGQPLASLADAFDNVGISDDSAPTAGNIDGVGDSYSAESLAAAGLSPGATVTADGVTFTWPDVPPGEPDNAAASGQVIAVSGSGSTLGFLGMADDGEHTGTGTIFYSDGTTQDYTVTYPDWFEDGPGDTSDQLVATGTVNGPFAGHAVSVLAAEVPLTAGKTITAIRLPDDADIHLFAIGIS